MSRCPEGHDSAADDYCDLCGIPMDAAPSPAPETPASPPPAPSTPSPASTPAPATQECPNCSAANAEANLFCEVCGFDFTTGVMPRVGRPSFLPPTPERRPAPETGPEEEAAAPQEREEPEESDLPSASSTPEPEPVPRPDPAPTPEPVVEPGPTPAPAASADPVRSASRPVNRPPSREVSGDWVVEVRTDPDWFAVQDTDEAVPSPAPPDVVRITGSDALVGRRSRTSTPEVDCGADSAVSRRQALLTSDGRRWWIEDLDSSNGTWVAPAIGPLPRSPITSRTEIDADDRVYVGAWTRLVLRPATASEIAGRG